MATAALRPSWASEIDQLDAAQAALPELAQKGRPEGLRLRGADVHAQHLAAAVAVDADGDDHRGGDDPAVLADLHVGRVEPEIGPVALDRPVEEGLHLAVDLLAQPADLALGDAGHAHRLDQLIDRAGRDALDVGFLDDGGERLLGHAPRLEEAREVAASPELGDPELDGAGPGLPVPIAVAVALRQPLGALLAIGRTGELADLQLHQPLGGKADHLAQQVGVRSLLDQRPQAHHLVGHRWSLGQVGVGNPTLPSIVDDRREAARSPACCGRARERLRYRRATPSGGTRRSLPPSPVPPPLRGYRPVNTALAAGCGVPAPRHRGGLAHAVDFDSLCAAASSNRSQLSHADLARSRRRVRSDHRPIEACQAPPRPCSPRARGSSFRATLRPLAEPPRPPGQPHLPPRSRPSLALDLGRDPGGARPRLRQPRPVPRNRLICAWGWPSGRTRRSPRHRTIASLELPARPSAVGLWLPLSRRAFPMGKAGTPARCA